MTKKEFAKKEFSKKEFSKVDLLTFAEKQCKETITDVITELLKLNLPHKIKVEVISTVIFASKVYAMPDGDPQQD